MRKLHYAWVICGSAVLTMICASSICGTLLSAYLPYIVSTGITGSQSSAILSLRSAATLVAMLFVSRYYEKVSLRLGITLALVLAGGAMLLFSLGGSAPVYYGAAVAAGTAFGLGSAIPVAMLISAWFADRRGTALGISSAGTGFACIFFPVVIDFGVARLGLRGMFLCMAAVVFLSALAVWLLVRSTPEDFGISPYADGSGERAKRAACGSWALPSGGWILLILLMVLQGGYGPAVTHLPVLMTGGGYGVEFAARVLSLYGMSVMAGEFLFGVLSDRVGAKQAAVASYCLAVGGCLIPLCMDGQALWPCAAAALLLGLGVPPLGIGIALMAEDLSTAETYARTVKWMQIISVLGGIVTGFVPGMFFDRFGSYRGAYMGMAVFAIFCIPVLRALYRSCRPAVP